MQSINRSLPSEKTLTKVRISLFALSFVIVVIWALWSAAPFLNARPGHNESAARFKSHLDARVPALLERFGVPGVSIATVADGKPGESFAYGFADVAQARPVLTDSVFEVASISKSFTAWG
jgi:CubicO group peptidase (beta-lactamase class C family)